ncbi:hypothetical protein CU102_12405 [Phyllobacterium brassicacearum]|uniref:Uncharacterized protein n=1 Tax=Phyllobacterium brassicacearum TaxID=314235 RepID=A0A2P7BQ28_9HYPH|nr:hypothetical protein [Phyllobacterium brassicacearum]PSH68559.1 hypothetical protein CU102_12405 [Phyllobacterium brassicacearum]TDQ19909.1 hypothetical protein DEV91_124104 [Phyllobacterium brassicacearum]
MNSRPISFQYEGEGIFKPSSGFYAKLADEHFVIGEHYKLLEHRERSDNSHRHYFASIKNGFDNLHDSMLGEYPTVEHLRKKALIRTGYRDERSIVCASKAEAERVAAFIRPIDDYCVVVPLNCVVHVMTAKSQSVKAMGAAEFQKSKEAVLIFIDDLLGVEHGATARSEAA